MDYPIGWLFIAFIVEFTVIGENQLPFYLVETPFILVN